MCRCPTRGDRLCAAAPPTGKMRKFSTRYGMKTTPRASGPGSGGATISLGAGPLSMGTTVLWAKAPVASMPAATEASAVMSSVISLSPLKSMHGNGHRDHTRDLGTGRRAGVIVRQDDAHVRRAIHRTTLEL